jgi:tetratricopeptide (TPR) repeat protein
MAAFLQDNGHDLEAEAYFEQATSLTDHLFDSFDDLTAPIQKEVRRSTGWLAVNFGDAQLDGGDLEQAGRSYRRAIELLAPAIEEPREWYWYRLLVGAAHRGLGMIARERKEKSAEQEFAEAERIARSVLKDASESDPRLELARTLLIRWDGVAIEPDSAAAGGAALDEAVTLLTTLAQEFPLVTWHRRDRALALLARGERHAAARRAAAAEPDLAEAQRLLTELMANDIERENWSYPGHRGRVDVALAHLRFGQGRADDGGKLLNDGIADLETACQHRPRHVRDRRSLDEARRLVIEGVSAAHRGPATKP